jgi:hypothetical protein
LKSFVACASMDCIIESVMVDNCPWWSEVLCEAFDFSSIFLYFCKGIPLLVQIKILGLLVLSKMVVLGDLGC